MTPDRSTSILVRRRLAWRETDAAGHNHFTAAFRWIEEAEHELYRSLGFDPAMTACFPRVHLEVDYRQRLFFEDAIDVHVRIAGVGRTSCRFEFDVRKPDGTTAVSGDYVVVHVASTTAGASPWPDPVRAALSSCAEFVVESITTNVTRSTVTGT